MKKADVTPTKKAAVLSVFAAFLGLLAGACAIVLGKAEVGGIIWSATAAFCFTAYSIYSTYNKKRGNKDSRKKI